jgi:hypothetical protein
VIAADCGKSCRRSDSFLFCGEFQGNRFPKTDFERQQTIVKKNKAEKPVRTWTRRLAVLLVFILAAFIASDGYFNEWRTLRRWWHWNSLELTGRSNSVWQLKAKRDFQLIPISDVRTITNSDSLVIFDKPYLDSGYYRLYFRASDSASAQLQKMHHILAKYDTAGNVLHSIEDIKRAFRNLQALLGMDSASVRDTTLIRKTDSTRQVSRTGLGGDEEISVAMRKVLASPQLIIGVGLGLALSAGTDLLRGDAYCAIAKNDVFHIDSIKLGAKAGMWQGDSIDVIWALRKAETQ